MNDPLARSDTLIVLSVDPQAKTAGILSVPRDLQVYLPGYGLQKINAAYFFGEADRLPGGGPGLALATVSQLFDVPIPYYITVDFDGFRKVVDELGGIDLYVPEAIDDPLYPGPYNSYMECSSRRAASTWTASAPWNMRARATATAISRAANGNSR